MQHDVGHGVSRHVKRKSCYKHGRVSKKKISNHKAVVSDKLSCESTRTNLAHDPIQTPRFHENKPLPPSRRRYYCFSVAKMARLAVCQSRFLCQYLQLRNPRHTHTKRFQALSNHISVAKADPTSQRLAFYYGCNTTIRGTCTVRNKRRKCIVLGMEHRQDAPSFRLYIAYFSPSRFQYMCYIRFLIKQVLYSFCLPHVLSKTIMDFCFYGIDKQGFEMTGAHYMTPKKIKGKPVDMAETMAIRPRLFTGMWNGHLQPATKRATQYIIEHARRDVQVHDLRIESFMYMNLIGGKLLD